MAGTLRWPRRHPPVHSPLLFRGVAGAALDAIGAHGWPDPRDTLKARIKQHYHADRVVLTGSGTQALQLAIQLARTRAGLDAVVALPAYTCVDVAAAAVGAGGRIALYDVDPHTLDPDPVSLAQALSRGAGVVVVTPLYGIPTRWDTISRLIAGAGATVVEDAAQGFGAAWRARPLGSLAPISILSFGRGKGWTGGAGGALLERDVTADPAIPPPAPVSRAEIRVVMQAAAQWLLARPAAYAVPAAVPGLHLGETRYRAPVAPTGITRAAAVILERTWEVACAEAAQRRANVRVLLEALAVAGVRTMRSDPEGRPGWLRLPIRVRRGVRGLTDPAVAMSLGAAPGYPLTLADLPAVRARLAWTGQWRGAETLVEELVTLATHSLLSGAERARLLRAVA